MSAFEVPVVRIDRVEDHPNADRLSLNYFREFVTVSAKMPDGRHRYSAGDYVVYVPEGAVVPENLLKQGFWDEKNNKGMLAGSKGNRVKAIKLRDVLSRGIMFPTWAVYEGGQTTIRVRNFNDDGSFSWVVANEGDDVAEFLGITKYIPPLPESMDGDVVFIGTENTINFDVENIQKFPTLLADGVPVTVTEKLHGTFCGFGYVRGLDHEDLLDGDFFCFSKGFGAKGIVFSRSERNVTKNVYLKTLMAYLDAFKSYVGDASKVFILGEVFGKGIQDLHYGMGGSEFRVFDVIVEKGGVMRIMSWDEMVQAAEALSAETAPLLYRGPWSQDVRELKNGKTTLADHVREGIVIRSDPLGMSRVMLKDINPDYLTRKGAVTEYN